MPSSEPKYDVVIVGASLAGSSAAILFAQKGLRVAVIERNPDLNAHKKVCTHAIQASATPTLRRLGVVDAMETAGAVRNGYDTWTRWGWIRWRDPERPHGYNLRRQLLDPLLRNRAAEMPGVDLFLGETARALIEERGRVKGVRVESPSGSSRDIAARLTVGADGRNSRLAELARLRPTMRPNERFFYFAHFQDLPLASGTNSQMWFLEPDIAYIFPNDEGVAVVACTPSKSRLPEFKRDVEGSFRRFMGALPDGPDLNNAQQVTRILGMLEMPNISRSVSRPGLALIGDAAMASDPLWGVGCGFAFQSAEWLADSTADAFADGSDSAVDRALKRYARKHRSALWGHHYLMADYATCRPFNIVERLFFSAAVHDFDTARHIDAFGSRRIGVRQFLAPSAVGRAAWVNLRKYGRIVAPAAQTAAHGSSGPGGSQVHDTNTSPTTKRA